MASFVKFLSTPGALSEEDLNRVKFQLKTGIMQMLTTNPNIAETVGRTVLTHGRLFEVCYHSLDLDDT